MLKTTVLICSLASNPDPSTCSPMTAIDLATFPAERATMCGLSGQSTIARTAIKPGPGQYAKIVCEPVRAALSQRH